MKKSLLLFVAMLGISMLSFGQLDTVIGFTFPVYYSDCHQRWFARSAAKAVKIRYWKNVSSYWNHERQNRSRLPEVVDETECKTRRIPDDWQLHEIRRIAGCSHWRHRHTHSVFSHLAARSRNRAGFTPENYDGKTDGRDSDDAGELIGKYLFYERWSKETAN